jgi:hypothetical protein
VGSIYSAFGVFVLPVSTELKLSRAQMNTAIGLVSLGNAVLAPIVGWLLEDKFVRKTGSDCGTCPA